MQSFIPIFLALLISIGWEKAAHGQEQELEVVGQLTLQVQAEEHGDEREISGRLGDESEKPVIGTISIQVDGEKVRLRRCGIAYERAKTTVQVPASGEFCVRFESTAKPTKITAEAPHFLSATRSVVSRAPGHLPPPRFSQTPQTIDLGSETPAVVEVLASSGSYLNGAELRLALKCSEQTTQIETRALAGSRLERFELLLDPELIPGNCQLIATSSAPQHHSVSDARHVLVRGKVTLTMASSAEQAEGLTVQVRASYAGGPVSVGMIEARSESAFLVATPVRNGLAKLELKRAAQSYRAELTYVPSDPAFVPVASLHVEVPAQAPVFHWASLHTLALMSFCLWLGYAWLRPRGSKVGKQAPSPPREATVDSSGSKTGPIQGVVRDAHTATPLANAKLRLFSANAVSLTPLEEQTTDADGAFQFTTTLREYHFLRLSAVADEYMNLESRVGASDLTVHLTHCRRKVIEQLVSWARRQGSHWHRPPASTPEDVARAARAHKQPLEETWAHSVAHAAYGSQAPSEEAVTRLKTPHSEPLSSPD